MSIFDNAVTALFKPARSIGATPGTPNAINLQPFTSYVTFEEIHDDEVEITQHPVEQGASITDHAYARPAMLTVHFGFSNSSLGSLINSATQVYDAVTGNESTGTFNYAQDMYQQLLSIKNNLILLDIVTGKRKYTNMLIKSLRVSTDQKTEHALMVTAQFQQLLIATVTASLVPTSPNQANPQNTASPTNQGTVAPVATTPNTSTTSGQ